MDKEKFLKLYNNLVSAEFTKIVSKKTFRSKVNQIDKLRSKVLEELKKIEAKKEELMNQYQEQSMQIAGEIEDLEKKAEDLTKEVKKTNRSLIFKRVGFNMIKIPVSATAALREKPEKKKSFGKIKDKKSLEQKHYLDIVETTQDLKAIKETFSLDEKPIRKAFKYQLKKLKLARLQKTSGLYSGLDKVRISTKELASKTMNFIKKPFHILGAKSNAYLERKKNEIEGLKELLENKKQDYETLQEDISKKEEEYDNLAMPTLSEADSALEESLNEDLKSLVDAKQSYIDEAMNQAKEKVGKTMSADDLVYAAALQGLDLKKQESSLTDELNQIGEAPAPVVETFEPTSPVASDDLFAELNAIYPQSEPQPEVTVSNSTLKDHVRETSFEDYQKEIERELGMSQEQPALETVPALEPVATEEVKDVEAEEVPADMQEENAIIEQYPVDMQEKTAPVEEVPAGKWVFKGNRANSEEQEAINVDAPMPETQYQPETIEFMDKLKTITPNVSETELEQLGQLFETALQQSQQNQEIEVSKSK